MWSLGDPQYLQDSGAFLKSSNSSDTTQWHMFNLMVQEIGHILYKSSMGYHSKASLWLNTAKLNV